MHIDTVVSASTPADVGLINGLFSYLMVRGKPQIPKPGANKRISTASKHTSSSPSTLVKLVKSATTAVPSCTACGIVITDDIKALQCDRCQATDKWKCAECLNLPLEMYDHLVSDPGCSLKWFCLSCDKAALEMENKDTKCNSDRLDCLITLVEKLLHKLTTVEDRLKEKCELDTANQLDSRLKNLEDHILKQEQDMLNKITQLENSLVNNTNTNAREVKEQVSTNNELQKKVEQEINKQITEDRDLEKRKKNIIIYRVPEVSAESAADRMDGDMAFVTELLDSVFQVKPDDQGIEKLFRLGQRDVSSNAPRPLLVGLKDIDVKEGIWSNLKNLKDSDIRFKGISVAHDLSPGQREEIKRLVEQAKRDHVSVPVVMVRKTTGSGW